MIMALDQEAIDEHVRITGDDFNVDDFMGAFFRRNGDREPVISDMAPMRCDISMTRPTTTPGVSHKYLLIASHCCKIHSRKPLKFCSKLRIWLWMLHTAISKPCA